MWKNNVKLWTITALMMGLSSLMYAAPSIEQYIEQYKAIAIMEMDRGGVPASITLAQGILESSFGNSPLATDAKNHFGIKCHDWEGEGYWKWDDESEPSCFRVYCNAEESFKDHTDFLTGRSRYASLFLLSKTDYAGWAKGLQKAGYATANDYADKLIDLIGRYQLYIYDTTSGEIFVMAAEKPTAAKPAFRDLTPTTTTITTTVTSGRATSELFPNHHRVGIFINNNLNMVIAGPEDTPESLAKKYNTPVEEIRRFNNLNVGEQLMLHQYVYLGPKRNEFHGTLPYHLVQGDETMYVIAQVYGLQLGILLQRNQLRRGEEPAVGQKIYLRGGMENKPVLRD